MNTTDNQHAHGSSQHREQFRTWLDSHKAYRLKELDIQSVVTLLDALSTCGDVLPADYCSQLELPKGSTYAEAVADVRQFFAQQQRRGPETAMLRMWEIVHAILENYTLPWYGTHGVPHWARVYENGLRLAKMTGAKTDVVQLFAVFHDSQRVNEGTNFGHGQRGADFAAKLRGEVFDLPDADFTLLYDACAGHTDGGTSGNVTVLTCWDADRLDLGRVGIIPEPTRLCTAAANQPEMQKWADGRAGFWFIPDLVRTDWGIDTAGWEEM